MYLQELNEAIEHAEEVHIRKKMIKHVPNFTAQEIKSFRKK